MKKLVFASVLFMSVFFAHAQVSINVNIGTPPSWGPQGNDDSRYYYLPDIDVYYDVNQSQYIYENNGKWIRDKRLPANCRQYDLYSGYKVVLNDYKGDSPYAYHKKHRANYPKGYQGKPQKNRGNKPEKNNKPQGNQKSNNGNGKNSKEQSRNDQGHSHDNDNNRR
ncbi:hypothetical protein GKZ90_0004125 [Flavobacterium sp. MC2016-06]|jgi:hypothetical protein|uniref:hypothetical protein n=1 Tax=Flavobacterium sp. MC2016-06 TaxID=2676308 RepID=UPI0012BA7871|nr:hypothetical protein [Flavobacterium sp. MC2016-06]MBU3858771.1 hypothetical protein [Flavobacterium sp. MC2016-06]